MIVVMRVTVFMSRLLGNILAADVLSRNIFKAQMSIFSPAFGKDFLLGAASILPKSIQRRGTLRPLPSKNAKDSRMTTGTISAAEERQNTSAGRWTRLACVAYEDAFLEIAKEVASVHIATFDAESIKRRMEHFFAVDLSEEIQYRVLRLTNTTVTFEENDLHTSRSGLLQLFPGKCASVVVDALVYLWISRTDIISIAFAMASMPDKNLRIAGLTAALIALGLMKTSEVTYIENPLPPPQDQVKFPVPIKPQTTAFLEKIMRDAAETARLLDGREAPSLDYQVRSELILLDNSIRLLVQTVLPFPCESRKKRIHRC